MTHMRCLIVFILSISIFLTGCGFQQTSTSDEGNTQNLAATSSSVKYSVLEHKQHLASNEISISVIGDILIHDRVYEDAEVADGYDFYSMLEKVHPYLAESKITIANQETMIGGTELGLSGYPNFNSPYQIGDTLKAVGIDVVTLANNHTLDRGEQAVLNAINHWKSIDMMYTGAFENEEDSNTIRVYQTEENIDVAILSYTYGTNGIPTPNHKEHLVNRIDKEKIRKDVNKADNITDVVLLSLHFGVEEERYPNQEQKELAQFAADLGVEVVIGHHPHVLQPIEWLTGENGNQTLVAYSVGNFLSGQYDFYNRIGGILSFSIEKNKRDDGSSFSVTKPKFLPTYVTFDENDRNYQVIPMYQLTDSELPEAAEHYSEMKNHMAQWIDGLEFLEQE